MKKIIAILYVTIHCIQIWGQGANHGQELANILAHDNCFQAIEYMEQFQDSIPLSKEMMTTYKYKMFGFMNVPDSSAIYLEKIIVEYPYMISDYNGMGYLLNNLLYLYVETGNYKKVIDTYDMIEQYIQKYPKGDEGWRKEELINISKGRQEAQKCLEIPKMQVIDLSKNKETTIDVVKKEPLINISIKCNGVSLNTWVDTGCSAYLFMSEKTANKCGLKPVPSPYFYQGIIATNGKNVRGNISMVDSLRIGDFMFTNIPVCVVEDGFYSLVPNAVISNVEKQHLNQYQSAFSFSDVMLGLPLLKMLGSFECNWSDNKVKLKLKSKVQNLLDEKPNLFLSNSLLYIHLLVNQNSYVGLLDSGAVPICLSLSPSYYLRDNNKISFSSDEKNLDMLGMGVYSLDCKYKYVLDPHVLLGNQKTKIGKEDVIAWLDKQPELWKDGLVGLPFLKKIGSIIKLDFVNMKLTVE